MSRFKIQLALQGGGAKFVALIAALRAIEAAEREGDIEVSRISGTSAGAFAAVLYAARVPMQEVIEYLKSLNPTDMFPKKSAATWILKILWGYPIYDVEVQLSRHIETLLSKGSRKKRGDGIPHRLQDLDIETILAVSDIRNRALVERSDANNIVESAIESAALPFLLKGRSTPGSTWLVDGGLCANLPAGLLQTAEPEFGPTLAISFRPTNSPRPATLLNYASALLNTAIDNWVERTKEQLGRANVHEIDTRIEAVKFDQVVGEALGAKADELNLIEARTRLFVRDFVERKRSELDQQVRPNRGTHRPTQQSLAGEFRWDERKLLEFLDQLQHDPNLEEDLRIVTTGFPSMLSENYIMRLIERGCRIKILLMDHADTHLLHARHGLRGDKEPGACVKELELQLKQLPKLVELIETHKYTGRIDWLVSGAMPCGHVIHSAHGALVGLFLAHTSFTFGPMIEVPPGSAPWTELHRDWQVRWDDALRRRAAQSSSC